MSNWQTSRRSCLPSMRTHKTAVLSNEEKLKLYNIVVPLFCLMKYATAIVVEFSC